MHKKSASSRKLEQLSLCNTVFIVIVSRRGKLTMSGGVVRPAGIVSLGDKRELGLTPLRARATELNTERDISDIIIH
jgi:hypothetical protein